MMEKLESEKLIEITLKTDAVIWFEDEKEILVNKHLFDVKSFVKKGDSIIFRGLFDEKETLLKKTVSDLVKKESNNASLNDVSITTIIFQLGYVPIDILVVPKPSANDIHYVICQPNHKLPPGYYVSPYAPPEAII